MRQMETAGTEATFEELRERISENDRRLLAAVNERLRLVAEITDYKRRHGLALVDAAREEALLDALAAANEGPISEEGLRALFRELLDLTKREVY
jgi:chorismate mutase/prephenate dehydratase